MVYPDSWHSTTTSESSDPAPAQLSWNEGFDFSPLWNWPSLIRQRVENRAFCRRCRAMLRESGKLRDGTSVSKTVLASTELPEQDGKCSLCVALLSLLSSEQMERMREHRGAGRQLNDWRTRAFKFEVAYGVSIDRFHGRRLELSHIISSDEFAWSSLELVPDREHSRLFNRSSVGSSTASQSSINTAKNWLHVCDKGHQKCSDTNFSNKTQGSQSFLPTRLIYVGRNDSTCLRLVEKAHITPMARYLTLSHCWGGYIPKRLLEGTLGVQYIWIDALCIIQDSEKDWQVESAQMDRIYTGTYCNISATAASNGSVGLFFDHDTGISQPLKVRVGSAHYRVIDSEFWRRNIEEAPLNRRAWVCQERMLSPRNLHFASTQMFWECRELSGCETFPMGFPPSVHRTTMTKRITSQDGSGLRLGLEFPVDPRLEAYSKWASIVQTYSKGSLTKETDKLVAIAGIAAQVQHLVDDRYLGGMWQRHLASSLTWEVNKDIPSMRPLSYVAPSWSWASVNGEITGLGDISYADGRDVLVDIVAAEVEYETSNIFGQVKGGSLCLQGNLARMAVNSADIFPTVFTEAPQPLNIVVKPDITYSNNERIEWHHEYLFALLTKDGRGRLPIGRIEGLLLETTGNAGQFLRWGKFSAGFDKIGVLYEACKFFDSKASESGLKYCDDGKGGYKYTITIV